MVRGRDLALFNEARERSAAGNGRSEMRDGSPEQRDLEPFAAVHPGEVLPESVTKLAYPDLLHVSHRNTTLSGRGQGNPSGLTACRREDVEDPLRSVAASIVCVLVATPRSEAIEGSGPVDEHHVARTRSVIAFCRRSLARGPREEIATCLTCGCMQAHKAPE